MVILYRSKIHSSINTPKRTAKTKPPIMILDLCCFQIEFFLILLAQNKQKLTFFLIQSAMLSSLAVFFTINSTFSYLCSTLSIFSLIIDYSCDSYFFKIYFLSFYLQLFAIAYIRTVLPLELKIYQRMQEKTRIQSRV